MSSKRQSGRERQTPNPCKREWKFPDSGTYLRQRQIAINIQLHPKWGAGRLSEKLIKHQWQPCTVCSFVPLSVTEHLAWNKRVYPSGNFVRIGLNLSSSAVLNLKPVLGFICTSRNHLHFTLWELGIHEGGCSIGTSHSTTTTWSGRNCGPDQNAILSPRLPAHRNEITYWNTKCLGSSHTLGI